MSRATISRWSVLLGATALLAVASVSTTGCKNGGGAESFGNFIPLPNFAAITSVIPNSGSILGGNSVTIIGSNLGTSSTASIGGTLLTNVAHPNTTTITGVIPAGTYPVGPADVAVVLSDQTVVLPGGYTFEDMTFTSITPNAGPISGNVAVVIRGTNFKNVPLSGVVLQGLGANNAIQVPLSNVIVSAAFDRIDAIVPPGLPQGQYNLIITSTSHGTKNFGSVYTVGNGQSTTMLITDIRSQPGNVTPAHGPLAGGTTVTLTADLAAPAPAGFVGNITVSIILPSGTVLSASNIVVAGNFGSLTFVTPAAPGFVGGPVTIRVDSSTQGFATASNGFTYDPASPNPGIASIAPSFGPQAGGTVVTITGVNFKTGSLVNVASVSVGGRPLAGLAVQSDTQLTGTTPASPVAGSQPVVILSTSGATSNSVNFDYVSSIILTAVNPNNGPVAGLNPITIRGANFTTATILSGSITIGGNPVSNITVINSTTVTGVAPKGDTDGPVNVVVAPNGGLLGSTLEQGYTYGPVFDDPKTPRIRGNFNSTVVGNQGAARAVVVGRIVSTFDAVTVNGTDNSISVTVNVASLGSGSLTQIIPNASLGGVLNNPIDVALADMNGDGLTDIVVLNNGTGAVGAQSVAILLNNGVGGFTGTSFATNLLPNFATLQATSIDVAPLNGDGLADVAVLGSSTATTNGVALFNNNPATPGTLVVGAFSALPAGDLGAAKVKIVGAAGTLGTHCSGTPPLDLNTDGIPDLVVVNAASATLTGLKGDGLGNFTLLTTVAIGHPNPVTFAVADVDESGSIDVVTANQGDGSITVVLGNGAGALTVVGSYSVPGIGNANFRSIVIGDVNFDCRNDVIVTSYNGTNLSFFGGNGDGTFSDPVNYVAESPSLAPTADILAIAGVEDSSGLDSIVCLDRQTVGGTNSFLTVVPRHRINLYLGGFVGTASFTASSQGVQPADVAFGDLNLDARLDMVVVNRASNTVQVYIGDGSGTFTQPFAPIPLKANAQPESVLIAKVDNNAFPSVLVACNGVNQIALLRNFGGGSLGNPVYITLDGTGVHQVVVEDMNGDGKCDIVAINQASNNVSLLLGDGTGNFVRATNSPYPVGNAPLSMQVEDLNGDGLPDIVVGNFASDSLTIMRQTGSSATNVTFAFSALPLNGVIRTDVTLPPTVSRGKVEPRSLAVGDLNGDGAPDIVTADGFTGTVTILHAKVQAQIAITNATTLPQVGDVIIGPVNSTSFATGFTPYRATVTAVQGVIPTLTITVTDVQGGGHSFTSVPLSTLLPGVFYPNDPLTISRANVTVGTANVTGVQGVRGTGRFFVPTDYVSPQGLTTQVGAPPVIFTVGTTPTIVKLFDMNHDGYLDIIVGNADSGDVVSIINQKEANFEAFGQVGLLQGQLVLPPTIFTTVSPAGEFTFKAPTFLDYGFGTFPALPHEGYPIFSAKTPTIGAGADVKFTQAAGGGKLLGMAIGQVTLDCPPSVAVVSDDNQVRVFKCK